MTQKPCDLDPMHPPATRKVAGHELCESCFQSFEQWLKEKHDG